MTLGTYPRRSRVEYSDSYHARSGRGDEGVAALGCAKGVSPAPAVSYEWQENVMFDQKFITNAMARSAEDSP